MSVSRLGNVNEKLCALSCEYKRRTDIIHVCFDFYIEGTFKTTKLTADEIDSRPISRIGVFIFGISSAGDKSSDFLAGLKHGFCGKTGGGGFGGVDLSLTCSTFVC